MTYLILVPAPTHEPSLLLFLIKNVGCCEEDIMHISRNIGVTSPEQFGFLDHALSIIVA